MGYLAHFSVILVKKLQVVIDNLLVNPDRESSQTNPFYPQNKGIGLLCNSPSTMLSSRKNALSLYLVILFENFGHLSQCD